MAVIVGAAVFLRTDPIYFIYQTADFGEYVNRANVVAAGGSFGDWFLNLFPAVLSVPSLIFGANHTVDAMPLLGLLLVVGIPAISHKLGFPPWTTVAAAFIAAFHIMPVWFSEFPASEMISAVLLTGMLLVLATAVADRSTVAAIVAGSFGFLLATARINATLLAPIVVLSCIAAVTLIDKDSVRTTTRFIWAFFTTSLLGFLYDITFSSPYFVEFQLRFFFPQSVTDAVARLRNPLVAIGVGVILGVALWGIMAVAQRNADRRNAGRWVSTYVPLSLLIGLFLFIAWRALSGSFAAPAGKVLILGPVLISFAIAGVLMGALRQHRMPPERRIVYLIATVAVIAFVALQSIRLGLPDHDVAPYFLYWHRYYVSEIFPIAVVLALWPLEMLMTRTWKVPRPDRWLRMAPVTVAIVFMALIGVEALGPNLAVASGSMFEDAYETIADLDRLTSDPADSPIVYLGSNGLPEGWIWGNTARLIALPLEETFGRLVVGNRGPREPDLQLSELQLVGILQSFGVDTVYLITDSQTVPDGALLAERGWTVSDIGVVKIPIYRLPWDRDKSASEQRYVSNDFYLHVSRVDR
jgi:hypothetical protein